LTVGTGDEVGKIQWVSGLDISWFEMHIRKLYSTLLVYSVSHLPHRCVCDTFVGKVGKIPARLVEEL